MPTASCRRHAHPLYSQSVIPNPESRGNLFLPHDSPYSLSFRKYPFAGASRSPLKGWNRPSLHSKMS